MDSPFSTEGVHQFHLSDSLVFLCSVVVGAKSFIGKLSTSLTVENLIATAQCASIGCLSLCCTGIGETFLWREKKVGQEF